MAAFMLEIPFNDPEKMEAFQELMDKINEAHNQAIIDLAEELNISYDAASDVMHLRSRSKWTPELEQQLLTEHKAGKTINIMEWPQS